MENMEKKFRRRRIIFMATLYVVVIGIIAIVLGGSISRYKTAKEKNRNIEEILKEYNQEEEQLLNEIVKLEDENYLNMKVNGNYFESDKGGIIFILPEDE